MIALNKVIHLFNHSKIGGLLMALKHISPKGGVDELAGEVVLDQLGRLLGQSVGHVALQPVGGVAQSQE